VNTTNTASSDEKLQTCITEEEGGVEQNLKTSQTSRINKDEKHPGYPKASRTATANAKNI